MSKSPVPSLGAPERCAQPSEDDSDPQIASRSCFSHVGNDLCRNNVRPRTCELPHDEPRLDGEKYIYSPGHSRICATGIYLPEARITTQHLLREIDTKARFGVPYRWLERVTGIKEKRIAPRGMLPSDMAVIAAKEALERAGVLPRQIDAIIYTGLTRDHLEPATAHIVQAKLGAKNAMVFDISNACHGFMNGVHMIDTLIATGQISYGLVVTGEQGSLFADEAIDTLKETTDRKTFIACATGLTLGDAGAAMVIGPKCAPKSGFRGMIFQSEGQHSNLCTAGGPLSSGPLLTDMPTQLREGGKVVTRVFHALMYERLGWKVAELAKCFVHQIATKGLFRMHRDLLGVPYEAMPNTADIYGNLVTANVPVNLHRSVLNHELRAGDKIYLSCAGSGFSVGQAGLIWDSACLACKLVIKFSANLLGTIRFNSSPRIVKNESKSRLTSNDTRLYLFFFFSLSIQSLAEITFFVASG